MKGAKNIFRQLYLISSILLLMTSMLWANDEVNYFDYLPKYRKFKSHYQIDKIEYRDKRTIIYFRFVVQADGSFSFFNGAHPNCWYLRTPPRMRGIEVQFKLLEIKDIRINAEQKMEALTSVPEVDYDIKRGDVITCEMHFVRIPNYIRMLDLIQGKDADLDQNKLNCFDIMIKTHESPLLGDAAGAAQGTERFEQSFPFVKPKTQNALLSAAELEKQKQQEAVAKSTKTEPYKEVVDTKGSESKPIDYRPGAMTRMADLSCNTRTLLPFITFKENEVKFAGRVKAMQDIKILYDYLVAYPQATLRLHGHTDIFGNDYQNLELSRERALAVKLELVKMGIDRDRIEIFFYGGRQPLKGAEKGSDENRRVEVEPLCKDDKVK